MIPVARRPLWAGRVAVLLGIILIALNLRSAVSAMSPIVALVSREIPLNGVGVGVLGTLPPIAFAVSGILAPLVAKRVGLEASLVFASAAMVVGPLIRAVSGDYAALVIGSVVVLAGMGFGNILLPPAVKKYFPDRIGQVTAAYATLMSIGVAVPALLASPIADAAGWRVAVGTWAALAVCALAPWLVVRSQHRRRMSLAAADALIPEADAALLGRMRRSRAAVAMAIVFAITAINTYAFFAWLPELLNDVAGFAPTTSGALLALFGIMGIPLALLVPMLAGRIRNVGIIVAFGVCAWVASYLGLLLIPTLAPVLWVILAGAGGVNFALCLALIGLRTRTPNTAVALSGFVQAIGYGAGALGPLVFGVLHEATAGWQVPLLFLIATSLVAVYPAIVLSRKSYVDDEISR